MTIRAVFFDLGGVILRTEYQAPRQQLAERLAALRQARYPDSRYASLAQCRMELGAAETFFKRHALPVVDTTRMSVEEIAARLRQS